MPTALPSAPTLLVLAGPAWIAAAREEASREGWAEPVMAASPAETVVRLARGAAFSHLLLEPEAGGGLLGDIIGIASSELDSGLRLILCGLGAAGMGAMMRGGRIGVAERPEPGRLAAACAAMRSQPSPTESVELAEVLPVLASGRLQMRYQPIVQLADRQPFALEVLARLVHPRHGLLAPDRFVALIEDAGHAAYLAETVLLHALADWNGRKMAALGLRIGINLPLDVVLDPATARRLVSLGEQAGIAAGQLVIELTETRPIPKPEALRPALDTLRAHGFRLSIDDVGPKMRDHSGLLDLPFSSLKLDRALVQASATQAEARAMLTRITAEARQAGIMVIAEGVETTADWERMVECGVDAAQGFLVARPLTAAAVPIWLDDWRQTP